MIKTGRLKSGIFQDGGNALLKMLKGNTQTTKRQFFHSLHSLHRTGRFFCLFSSRFSYTKAELLKIATLPASNVKPVDLDPIIDKDNKDLSSQSLTSNELSPAATAQSPPVAQDSVLLIRIAASREEHEANGEDRARRNSRQANGNRRERFVFFNSKWKE